MAVKKPWARTGLCHQYIQRRSGERHSSDCPQKPVNYGGGSQPVVLWILSNMDWPCKSLDLNIIEAVWLNWEWEHNIQRIALEWPLRLPQEMARNFRLNWILKAVIPNFKFLRIVQTLYKVFPCMFLDVTVHCYSHLLSYIRKWGAAQDFCAVLYAWHSLHAKKKCHSHRLQIRQNSQLPGHPVEVLQK